MDRQDLKKQICNDHEFAPLGFNTTKTEQTKIEAVAAIFCKKCGMFRTKILTFRRELMEPTQL